MWPTTPKSIKRLAFWPSPKSLICSLFRHALMEVTGRDRTRTQFAVRKLATRTDGRSRAAGSAIARSLARKHRLIPAPLHFGRRDRASLRISDANRTGRQFSEVEIRGETAGEETMEQHITQRSTSKPVIILSKQDRHFRGVSPGMFVQESAFIVGCHVESGCPLASQD